jgi:hypothetical protein
MNLGSVEILFYYDSLPLPGCLEGDLPSPHEEEAAQGVDPRDPPFERVSTEPEITFSTLAIHSVQIDLSLLYRERQVVPGECPVLYTLFYRRRYRSCSSTREIHSPVTHSPSETSCPKAGMEIPGSGNSGK